jgi:hypothetical protein
MHDEENGNEFGWEADSAPYYAPRYSQPLASSPPPPNPPVVRAAFVDGQPGFIFRGEDGKVKRVLATKENRANEKPAGFFHSLARLMYGSNR